MGQRSRLISGAATTVTVLVALLAAPALADASQDLAIGQSASATVVKPGESVTFAITISNRGTEPPPYSGEAIVDVTSFSGHGQPANNPYLSFSTSQGSCVNEPAGAYQQLICQLGPIAPGASARITAVVKVNETMNHNVTLLPNTQEGGYEDGDNSNNQANTKVTVSVPPTVTGSKKIKLPGLPGGCVSGDFKLMVVPAVGDVKKIVASLFLGFDETGEGRTWQKVTAGRTLKATVPASQIFNPQLNKLYKLKVKVRRKGGGVLKRVVEFQRC
jgi:Domain of unknown function DUF11